MKPLSSAPQAQQCEPVFELLTGSHGRLSVGHMLKGTDAGRMVTLRRLADTNERISAAVDIARSIAHPQISKVLGVVRGQDCFYVASEYTPGVPLHELTAALRKQQTRLKPAAAVRVLREASRAAAVAEELLAKTAGLDYVRALFADTIWIAEYGDVLVTEVGLAPLVNETRAAPSALDAQARDIVSAGMELFQLCTGHLMTMDALAKLEQLPSDLAAVVKRALLEPGSFGGPSGLCAALEALPKALQSSEQQLADELRRVMRSTLETRRHTLNALRQSDAQIGEDEVTHFSRPSGIVISTTRDTTRPPPGAPAARALAVQAEAGDGAKVLHASPAAPPTTTAASRRTTPDLDWQSAPTRLERLAFDEALPAGELDSSPPDSDPFRRRGARRRWWALAVVAVAALLAALLREHYLG